jgi:hypothetical protein
VRAVRALDEKMSTPAVTCTATTTATITTVVAAAVAAAGTTVTTTTTTTTTGTHTVTPSHQQDCRVIDHKNSTVHADRVLLFAAAAAIMSRCFHIVGLQVVDKM